MLPGCLAPLLAWPCSFVQPFWQSQLYKPCFVVLLLLPASSLPYCSYMAELSKHVPIIPVIMKADTMTIHEAQRFRQEVVNRLQNPGAHLCVCVGGVRWA